MTNVITLGGQPVKPMEPNQTVIYVLRSLLAMAESGQLQTYIGTGFTEDGLRVSTWADFHPNTYEMLGSLAWLQAEYIKRVTERNA
ncbi:MAG: hypothetical protein B7Y69_09320 [Sphingobacteriia bacterium 35-40-8]|jgi:hypothetical protein|nr:MAG: hypothetical protein B7Y69_09320 [Sphingobacteriia bacterium 35-40-8]